MRCKYTYHLSPLKTLNLKYFIGKTCSLFEYNNLVSKVHVQIYLYFLKLQIFLLPYY